MPTASGQLPALARITLHHHPPPSHGAPPRPAGCIGTCKEIDFFKMHRRRVEIYSTEPRRDVDMRRFFQEGVQMAMDGTVNSEWCGVVAR